MTIIQISFLVFGILLIALIAGWITFKRIMKPFFNDHK